MLDGITFHHHPPFLPHPPIPPFCRASDNSREKKSNFAGFAETNSRRKRPISREFSEQILPKSKEERIQKKIYWKDAKFRARKKTQKFIQHSSEGNCTCFEWQEKHKLNRNARPVNLLCQLQFRSFRAEHSNAINFFSLLALLCCFVAYKARLLVIEGSNPFVKSKHSCVFDCALYVRLNMCLRYYRQQFSFTLRIVSTKSLLISCAPMGKLVTL